MHAFEEHVRETLGLDARGYDALHAWSVRDPGAFWDTYARWSGITFDEPWRRALSGGAMPEVRWFEGARLNLARVLMHGGNVAAGVAVPGTEAVVALDEGGGRRALSWADLAAEVGAVQESLKREGVREGDRIAAFASNGVEALVLFLACAGLGAVFTSCSPDFGAEAATARFAQVAPRLLFASPSYRYAGRRHDVSHAALELARSLPGLARLIWLPAESEAPTSRLSAGQGPVGKAPGVITAGSRVSDWSAWKARASGGAAPCYRSLPFDHPAVVLYSSGTTGVPKAMVHRAGGMLLTHHKEHRLHCDIRPGDRVLFFTTTGWMMWNWVVSALAQGATLVLYEGSPVAPDPLALWRAVERERLTFLGVGARYLHALAAANVRPRLEVELETLRTLASTGSPLAASGFAYVYEEVKHDLHLASISGGTDIVGCFALGVPTLSVYDGQLQRPGLGVDLAVFDETGAEVKVGSGELVCRTPLPSMPLGFWDDPGSGRYRAAYFERFPGVWHHGDLVERTAQGGVIVHGRSDATLNPGGVRIGTAEIYRPLEGVPEVLEACAVGKRRESEEEVWLLLVLREGVSLDAELVARVRSRIKEAASPRHVPARVLQVRELPRTRSGKAMELAVRHLVNGESVTNLAAMANPEACDALLEALADAD